MFDWSEEELGDIIWGEASEVDDHIVPYPRGNEEKPLFMYGDHKKKQCIQEARPAKLADQIISGANSLFSGFKLERSSQCNIDEALRAPGAEIDSWPDSPLTNVACDGEYAGSNAGNSNDMQVSEFGTEMPIYDSTRADADQLDDGSGLFGSECEDNKHGSFLEYSWDNIGTFDDLDNMFRHDDPLFEREGLGNAELWSSATDLFSSPTKSFPACSPNSGVNALCTSEDEMKLEFVQHENLHTPGFGKTDHLSSYDMKDVDHSKDKAAGKQCFHFVDPIADCVGGKSKNLLEEKTNTKTMETEEAWMTHSTSKVNGKRKLLKCPTKEESEKRSSQDLHGSWPLTANQFQSFGDQFVTSAVQTIPSSVGSQKQLVGPESLLYWQTSHPYLSARDGNLHHHYPMMPTLPNGHSEREKHQTIYVDYGNSPGQLKHANPLKVFPAPTRPPIMTPQEKLDKLKRRQQMQAMLAIQEQQQQFGHQVSHTDLHNAEKCPQENQHQDTEGSTIEIEENLKIPSSMELNSPIEHDDSNTVAIVIDDCPLEERVLDQLQDVIEKLGIDARLCIRDSLFRLAQSAMQRQNTIDTSSTNNNMLCDGVTGKDEPYGRNRLPRIPEVETVTNPIDRTIAHLLFHQPLESSIRPVKDAETPGSPGSTKLVHEPTTEDIKNFSVQCLSDCSIDKQNLSQPSCMGSDTRVEYQFQSNTCINTPENTLKGEPKDHGE